VASEALSEVHRVAIHRSFFNPKKAETDMEERRGPRRFEEADESPKSSSMDAFSVLAHSPMRVEEEPGMGQYARFSSSFSE
jgi:hypothetical protein